MPPPTRPAWSPDGRTGPLLLSTQEIMNASKNRRKPLKTAKTAESAFVVQARKAIRKAQRTAARENARFGLRLIVQESR